MKVYIILIASENDTCLDKVFSSLKKALKYLETNEGYWEEREVE